MKIVVIGGSGLIASKLVKKLREDGHDPLAASPDSGVGTLTAEGLAEALGGAEVVVDVSNASVWDDAAMRAWPRRASRTGTASRRPGTPTQRAPTERRLFGHVVEEIEIADCRPSTRSTR